MTIKINQQVANTLSNELLNEPKLTHSKVRIEPQKIQDTTTPRKAISWDSRAIFPQATCYACKTKI